LTIGVINYNNITLIGFSSEGIRCAELQGATVGSHSDFNVNL